MHFMDWTAPLQLCTCDGVLYTKNNKLIIHYNIIVICALTCLRVDADEGTEPMMML